MKPKFEMSAKLFDTHLELHCGGELSNFDKHVLFDQFVNALRLTKSERVEIATVMAAGGMAKVMGKSYGTEIRFDTDVLDEILNQHKKEGNN